MTLLKVGISILEQHQSGGGISRTGLLLWKALRDGSYLDKITPGNLNLTGDFTFEFWVKFDNLNAAYNIFQKKTTNQVAGYGVHVNTSGDFRVEYSDGNNHFDSTSTQGVSALDTYFYAGITKTSSQVKIYIDGVLIDTISNGSAAISGNSDDLTIASGTSGLANSTSLNGILDDLRIYNRTLTADEITLHYNLGYGKYKTFISEFSNEFSSEFK